MFCMRSWAIRKRSADPTYWGKHDLHMLLYMSDQRRLLPKSILGKDSQILISPISRLFAFGTTQIARLA